MERRPHPEPCVEAALVAAEQHADVSVSANAAGSVMYGRLICSDAAGENRQHWIIERPPKPEIAAVRIAGHVARFLEAKAKQSSVVPDHEDPDL
jgi:hypothetical protein